MLDWLPGAFHTDMEDALDGLLPSLVAISKFHQQLVSLKRYKRWSIMIISRPRGDLNRWPIFSAAHLNRG